MGKPDEEEIVITVVGVPEVGMAGVNVLLVGVVSYRHANPNQTPALGRIQQKRPYGHA